jgi:AhpD family alkylhydroperoxidase
MNANSAQPAPIKRTGRLDFFRFGPEAMHAMEALERRIARCDLDKPLVELVRLRVSQVNGCAYCIDRHARDARALGVDERRLTLLPVWQDTVLFTERERAALAWAEALTRVAGAPVPEGTWEAADGIFVPSQLVDLTLVITTTNAWNRFAIGFRKLPA